MALVLALMPARAAIYIVGNAPFGDWNPAGGVEMTDQGNGIYTFSVNINGTVWFVFADGQDSDWNTFNSRYRYGPNGNGSQDVVLGREYTTQKSNNNHSYKFTGSGEDYTITFNLSQLKFSITEYQEPEPPVPDPYSLQVGDVNGDGSINISDITEIIDIILGGSANYDVRRRADVNYDKSVNIADITALIDYILTGDLPEPVKEGYDYVWDDDALPELHIGVSLS